MANRHFSANVTPAWRFFWRCVAGLLVFAQVALAADQCLLFGNADRHAAQAITGDLHQSQDDTDCSTDPGRPDQAPAADPSNLWAALGPPIAPPVAWPLSMQAVAQPAHYVAPGRHVSPTLLFLNLRL